MDIKIIVFAICYLLTLGFIYLIIRYYIKPYLDRKNDIKEKQIKNEKYELFKTIDPDVMRESLDKYFESYVNRYITYKFIAKKEMYIKSEEVETMVRDITKLVYMQISELYVFYINMTQAITTDEDLVAYIHAKVENTCIEAVSNYNGSMMG